MIKGKLQVLHAFDTEVIVDLIPIKEAASGQVFFVSEQETWTVSQTDEQKDQYIARLEDRLSEAEYKLDQYTDILFPERYDDDI